jgi:23S rRNA pseudouridine1911/1915/1917 synthase
MSAESEPLDLSRPDGVSEEAIVRVVRVPPEAAGTRLDVFLPRELRNTSRTRARAIIERSAFSVDAKKLHPSDRVRAGEHIVLWREPFDEIDAPREIAVLYEDEHILAIDKPPLMAVHPTARHHMSTVIVQLRARRPDEFLSLVHRIDRETSGVLIVARSRESERAFKRVFEDRSIAVAAGREAAEPVEKEYLALTWGTPASGMIDLPIELDPENSLRVKMRVAPQGGLEAKTEISVLETRGRYALSRCRLLTGRQHQIRIHLAAGGTPIVGDKLYGPDERLLARAADNELSEEDLAKLELPRHALHAHRYQMRHAVTGQPLELVSPLAKDLREFWESR